jgi:A-macroglobulin TED domain/Alpha-2-macroglobulin family/Carboxypeptidase regulatory-like domain/MG2 domain/A-macroglobulin receptor binding domain/Alpha-2-macroglobulin bait region domain/Macroglobulin domain MG3
MPTLWKRLCAFRPVPTLLLIATAVSLVIGLGREPSGGSFTAIYKGNQLLLSIPYQAKHTGSGTLTLEILDPEDQVLGRAERPARVAGGDGEWKQELRPDAPLALEDIVWDRVRYRFTYRGEADTALEGIRPVSEILLRPTVHVIGQSSYLAGAPAAVRVVVSDSANREIPGNATVRVELLAANQQARRLFDGPVNSRGTVEARFRFPAGLAGNYQLHFVAETPLGTAENTQPVRIESKASILLTTEKRMYQPGQTVHVRSLALDRSDHHAMGNGRLTFEIRDPRGNKVLKKETQTDEFGVASTDFRLADEVNLGAYQLHVLTGDPASPTNTADLTFNVDRYVLPKFKVAITLTEKNGKPQRDYRPGDHVTGTVQANYFFGKPVDHAAIVIKASSMDVELTDVALDNGHTDKNGAYHFDFRLPTYFAGRPLNSGTAPVLLEATVKDTSGHSEMHDEAIIVSESPLLVTAIPEGGTLVPGLENQVFLLTSYADGTPALTDMQVHVSGAADQHVTTDERGVAIVRITPGTEKEPLKVKADDRRGSRVSTTVPLQPRAGTDQVLLRPDRAVYRAGEVMVLRVFSTAQSGSAYVDVVKDGQTVLTKDVDLTGGNAQLRVTATPELSGTLDLNVYRFGSDGHAIGDHRLVFVQPAGELHVEAVADSRVYKPGAEARVQFKVTNEHGEGVHAVLGLQVVDEAVFALTEKQPGFAKTFFLLEHELLKPRYEIHSLSWPDVVDPHIEPTAAVRDRDARALLSATYIVNPNQINLTFGQEVPQQKAAEYAERYRDSFEERAAELAARLKDANARVSQENARLSDAAESAAKQGTGIRDAWGTEIRIDSQRRGNNNPFYRVVSAGPDRLFGTGDDLTAFINVRSGMLLEGQWRSSIQVKMEHESGGLKDVAEVTGTVRDVTGAAIPRAKVAAAQTGEVANRRTVSDREGHFQFRNMTPGSYEIEITAPGFAPAKRWVSLKARDTAALAGALTVGTAMQEVRLEAGDRMARDMFFTAFQPKEAMVANGAMELAMRAPAPPRPTAAPVATSGGAAGNGIAAQETHVRSYFPEALFINPEIITDRNGVASVTIPIADSITTWRMAMLASTTSGMLGSSEASLKVFQDFFVDLDLPVTLTQGDRVSIPVAVYNYAGERGDVKLSLERNDWFALDGDQGEKELAVEAGRVGGSSFTVEAKRIGHYRLKLSAVMRGATQRRDIVVREIEVVPNGREQNTIFNGHLDSAAQQTVRFPTAAIADASRIFVRLYPGPLSQVIEGMDAILQMPGGCFEQTSSSTYPNVLALDYMKRTKKLTPEVHAKADGYIANGYQRLLTFEVQGGGFSWFGNAPANKILTAYGLMEFHDMAQVHDVDPKVIERTSNWLVAQQEENGTWKPDQSFINEGATTRFNSDLMRITAYIAWSLENSGYRGPALDRAQHYLADHLDQRLDSYTLAVLANFAVEYSVIENSKSNAFARQVMQMLIEARLEKDKQSYWNAEETGVFARGTSATIETTGLAVQALLKWRQAPEITRQALAFIASKKDANGAWGTTQATIMALRALLTASEGTGEATGDVEITLNGKLVEKLALTKANGDLFHQFVLPGIRVAEPNNIDIRFHGSGSLGYQVVGRYFVPWEFTAQDEPLSISVDYDRTKLAENETVNATATIKNNLNQSAKMVMVDLGIPPGFELLTDDLDAFKEKTKGLKVGSLEKFSLTATQAILYFNGFDAISTVKLHFRLRAKYPIRARNFESRVYEYYDPAMTATARPQQFEVRGR